MKRLLNALKICAVLVVFATKASAAGTLFIATETEEFAQANSITSDRIARFETVGASMVGGLILNTPFHVAGLTVVNGELVTGTVGTEATTASDGQTLRRVNFDGVEQSSVTADILTGKYNSDLGFDGTSIWHAHFFDGSTSQIRQLDNNNLNGPAVSVYNLSIGVFGVTVAEGDIWISDWSNHQVGTWDPGLNLFTPVFTTPSGPPGSPMNPGGLAYDPTEGVLWVGLHGGLVLPYDLTGQQLGAGFLPFGATTDNITGLAFSPIPEPSTLTLAALGLVSLPCCCWRRRRRLGNEGELSGQDT